MRDRFADELRIGDVEGRLATYDRAAIADLSALFGVERGVIQKDLRAFTGNKLVDRLRRSRIIITISPSISRPL